MLITTGTLCGMWKPPGTILHGPRNSEFHWASFVTVKIRCRFGAFIVGDGLSVCSRKAIGSRSHQQDQECYIYLASFMGYADCQNHEGSKSCPILLEDSALSGRSKIILLPTKAGDGSAKRGWMQKLVWQVISQLILLLILISDK